MVWTPMAKALGVFFFQIIHRNCGQMSQDLRASRFRPWAGLTADELSRSGPIRVQGDGLMIEKFMSVAKNKQGARVVTGVF